MTSVMGIEPVLLHSESMPVATRHSGSFLLAVVVIAFGMMTLGAGGIVLTGHADAGHVVPFVLWFNFLAGFAYVLAGIGILRALSWAPLLASLIALATALVGLAFIDHVASGGAFESRTAAALAFRCLFWVGVAWFTHRDSA